MFRFFFICSVYFFSSLSALDFDPIVEKHIEEAMRAYQIPGACIAVVYKEESKIYAFGFANLKNKQPITEDTIFEIASITKVFTSTALALEVINHQMSLTDSLVQYMPKLKNSQKPISKVTLLELATHTSSLPREPPFGRNKGYTNQDLLNFLKNWTPKMLIGTNYLYSNLGFGLLGRAIANQEKISYEEAIQKLVLNPLQMNSTFVKVPSTYEKFYAQGYNKNGQVVQHYPMNLWPGGGALRSSCHDMLLFLKANMNLKGPKNILQGMQLAQKPYFTVNPSLKMGLAWQLFTSKEGLQLIDKNGGVPGFSSYMGFIPEKQIGIVILFNKGKAQATRVGRDLLYDLAKSSI